MKRAHLAGAAVAALAACLLVPFAGSAAGPPDVVCPQDTMTFTGTAHDLIVPAGGYCAVTGATITHDLILQDGAGADVRARASAATSSSANEAGAAIVDSTVGHDIVAGGTDSGADVIRDDRSGTTSSRAARSSGFDRPASRPSGTTCCCSASAAGRTWG